MLPSQAPQTRVDGKKTTSVVQPQTGATGKRNGRVNNNKKHASNQKPGPARKSTSVKVKVETIPKKKHGSKQPPVQANASGRSESQNRKKSDDNTQTKRPAIAANKKERDKRARFAKKKQRDQHPDDESTSSNATSRQTLKNCNLSEKAYRDLLSDMMHPATVLDYWTNGEKSHPIQKSLPKAIHKPCARLAVAFLE